MADNDEAIRKYESDNDEAISKAVEFMTGSTNASRRIVKGYLEEAAREDPTVGVAFQERETNPEAWNQSLSRVTQEFHKDWGQKAADEAQRINNMSQAEFTRHAENLCAQGDAAKREERERRLAEHREAQAQMTRGD